ncbi:MULTISPECIES: hypothetical protein [Bradyrhizobium]|uniref:Uncharacterized protein n=1 Tax=Bradyrhizobium septentrionale TaxID=1404411 RepID=A0A973VY91_9BRAD|nr:MULTISPECIES: hypothetical protein [Bradyrhizobium]QIG93833.1 hypothetical protein G6P99_15930 [Bradyrhizobium sp. 6(2017)]UGY12495.1 hypothetical protein HAP48_0028160 [Bradyrhizobium septentrionale]UGY25025.1 hypothetical protein HU675_0045380 [Bradyrhizobium septentrionale]
MITAHDKLQCAERELKYRRRIYLRLVERGKIAQALANRELELMDAIAEDYRKQVAQERLV